jgi:pimeloyl-ACP methyl ester carboxylesterase
MASDNETMDMIAALREPLDTIATHVALLSAGARIAVLYSEPEARELATRYRKLIAADKAALLALEAIVTADNSSWEAQVEAYGETGTLHVIAPHKAAVAVRNDTLAAIARFKSHHPLIALLASEGRFD